MKFIKDLNIITLVILIGTANSNSQSTIYFSPETIVQNSITTVQHSFQYHTESKDSILITERTYNHKGMPIKVHHR